VNHTQYDVENFDNSTIPPESYCAYGALVLGKGVCEAYSEAMKLIMDKLGIECTIVTGESQDQNHAWNIIKIDNEFYQLDVTWNDPVIDDGSNTIRYDYFNITDSEMARDHSWETDSYPACTSTKHNYFYYNSLVVSSYDEFLNSVKNALATGLKKLTLKVENYDENTYDIISTVNKAARQTPGVSFSKYYYSSNPTTGIIEIEFE